MAASALSSFGLEAGHVPNSTTDPNSSAGGVSAGGAGGAANTDLNSPPNSNSNSPKLDSHSGPPPPAASLLSASQVESPTTHLQLLHPSQDSSQTPSSPSTSNLQHHKNNPSSLHTHRQNHNSSKLPAFRFADLTKKDSLALPSLLQQIGIPPSPVSPSPEDEDTLPNSTSNTQDHLQLQQQPPHQSDQAAQRDLQPPNPVSASPENQNTRPAAVITTHHRRGGSGPKPAVLTPASPESPPTTKASPTRSRASTYQTPATSTQVTPSTSAAKRPASLDSPTTAARHSDATKSQSSRTQQRRAPASFSSNGSETSAGLPSTLSSRRFTAAQAAQASDSSTKDWAQGQRELLLPKAIQSTIADDKADRRKSTSRPPVSFRPPLSTSNSARAVIPPIRGFRSSGSRKSLVLDMATRSIGSYDEGDHLDDSGQRDRTLRALEGRADDDYTQMTPPDSAAATPDGENTADIFMRIAREDVSRRVTGEGSVVEEPNAITRVVRTTRRRPLSAAVPSHQTTSPPQITRRLSDQRETSRTRRLGDDQSAQPTTRELSYRTTTKEKPALSLDRSRMQSGSVKPSPVTPRSLVFQDVSSEGPASYSRRRPSISDSNSGLPSRSSTFKHTYGLPKTYNSSPLVPRSADPHHGVDLSHGLEGTESSASTAAPSTVWDELDDLKSRINRLELTGKLPATSGAAMSRVSDERPPTATTNATTMSASPKRGSGNGAAQADVSSTTSSQRDNQPILLSALNKSKPFVSSDVFSAIESAATDALALSQMMGIAGQPGPISSGASTIGGAGPSTVTDRQLRKKADSICRSLTELCLALSEEVHQKKPTQPTQATTAPAQEKMLLNSPTMTRVTGISSQRRGSALADQPLPTIETTISPPRAASRLEERRANMLNSTALSSPRFALAPNTPTEGVTPSRKSSLLIGRTRRAGTEEPEDTGRKTSLLLRTRRAGTEEPEEPGRKTSLLLRSRAAANTEEQDEPRFRAPSRAVTEVGGLRASHRDYSGQAPTADSSSLGSSALPRRRLVPSSLNSRLVAPSTPTTLATRRYLDRSTPDRDTNSVVEKLAEDRGQRQFSLGQTALLNRTTSLSRRRESAIPSMSSSASQAGTYR